MIEDLLVDFDEMGFMPTTTCEDPNEYALEWKQKLIAEIELIKDERDFGNKVIKDLNGAFWERSKKISSLYKQINEAEEETDRKIKVAVKDAEKTTVERVCAMIDECIGDIAFEYTDRVRKIYKLPTKYGF